MTQQVGVPAMIDVTGTVERVVFRNAETGWTVLLLRRESGDPLTVVGSGMDVQENDAITASGAFEDDPAWGRRFRAQLFHPVAPSTPEGMETFLGSGRIKGLGPVLARRLVRIFGERLPKVIEDQPDELAKVDGVGKRLAARIAETWQAMAGEREALLFLNSHGLNGMKAAKILGAYGGRTVARLSADPWGVARDVDGIGFQTADRFALTIGRPADDPERITAGVRFVLEQIAQGQGDTLVQRSFLRWRLAEMLGVGEELAELGIDRALRSGAVALRPGEPEPLVALDELDRAEATIAHRLAEIARGRPSWQVGKVDTALAAASEGLELTLAASQVDAVVKALVHRLLVVTGGPGTGKTTIVRTIVRAVEHAGGQVRLAAPTGRAARRLFESTGHEATTLHRLLEADPGHGFRRDADRPLEGDLFIVDEASMIDVQLMAALVQALPEPASLLLVGDVDQLPSVGPGRVLGDLIDSDVVPVVRLDEIFRQADQSRIVANAHRINHGQPPETSRGEALGDFYAIRVADAEEARRKLAQLLLERIPGAFQMDPVTEVQVLVPTNRGLLGTIELNRLLQSLLNPHAATVLERGEQRFAVGDRVMQVENDYERELSNGDVGRVVAIARDKQEVEVAFDERRLAYKGAELDALIPAYAVTVHKAQGSEYPCVVIILAREHGRMLRRDLLYTAVTRARRLVVVLAEPQALARAVESGAGRRWSTGLATRLRTSFADGLHDGPAERMPS